MDCSAGHQPSNTSSASTGDHFVVNVPLPTHQTSALLRQLSSELFDPLTGDRLGLRQCSVSGCDSSNCLFCQGLSHGPFCSPVVSDRVCSWLGRHLSAEAVRAFGGSALQAPGHQQGQPAGQQQQQQRERCGATSQQEEQQLHAREGAQAELSQHQLPAQAVHSQVAHAELFQQQLQAQQQGPADQAQQQLHGQAAHSHRQHPQSQQEQQQQQQTMDAELHPPQQRQPKQRRQEQQQQASPSQLLSSAGSAFAAATALAVPPDGSPVPKRARLRRPQSVSDFTDGSENTWLSPSDALQLQGDTQQLQRSCSRANTGSSSSSEDEQLSAVRPWRWQRRFERRADPAPAALQEVATLTPEQQRSGSGAGQWVTRRGHCDIVCALEFSEDGRLLASAGISKQVRLYALDALWADSSSGSSSGDEEDDDDCRDDHMFVDSHHAPGATAAAASAVAAASSCAPQCPPVAVLRMPSKISSCAWSPDVEGVLTIGDYDGTISQVHVASGHQLNDVDAHAGRRIWSVRHSKLTRHLAASGSEDRCAKLWAGPGLAHCAAVIAPPSRAAVCCVDFSESSEHLLALACSDHNVYVYDVRASGTPLVELKGHGRPVSYVRFFGGQRLASASTDGTLAVWELGSGDVAWQQGQQGLQGVSSASLAGPSSTSGVQGLQMQHKQQQQQQLAVHLAAQPVCAPWQPPPSSLWKGAPWKTFAGHTNERNFVGLAVRPEDGLLACGSEGTDAFVYHTSWSAPLARASAGHAAAASAGRSGTHAAISGSTADGDSAGGDAGAGVSAKGTQHYVSAVAWQQRQVQQARGAPVLLAAANTLGSIKLLSLVVP